MAELAIHQLDLPGELDDATAVLAGLGRIRWPPGNFSVLRQPARGPSLM